MKKRILIVGGVAGGATCAARLRRLSEEFEIIVFEKGEYISFANCGLPYLVGGVIDESKKLVLQTPEFFKARFNVDVRIKNEVLSLDRTAKTILIKNLESAKTYKEEYDVLVLSPGAKPIRPALDGINDQRIFTLRTIPDARAIQKYLETAEPKHALIIGAGFIGLEMAENLHNKGLKVTVIEKLEQVMPPFDPEMANAITRHLKMKGISFKFGKGVESFDAGKSFAAVLEGGERINCDMVVLAIGVSPDTTIAKDAGLLLNTTGAIIVDSKMMTSDENIFAIGDAVTVENPILGDNWQVALAGPASRQARIAADVISGMDKRYNGTIGTSIVKIFDITAASTGCSEKLLKRAGRNYKKVYTNVPNHVSYYPGARPMSMKLLFDADNGAVLGAQIVGVYGVDRRIDVIATAIAGKIPADKLKNLELAYAPPYGAAKDPVNMLGFMAENTLNGMSKTVHFDEVAGLAKKGAIIIDVRTAEEYMAGRIDGSINIDLNELRGRISEIPRDKPLITYCQIGFRGYLAERILRQKGFDVSNLSGGYLTYIQAMRTDDMPVTIEEELPISDTMPNGFALRNTVKEIDACGLSCPGPIKKTFEAMDEIAVGERITIKATDPGFASDITSWCKMSGNRLIKLASDEGIFSATIERGTVGDATNGRENMTKDRLTLVVFSEKLDKVMAAFIIATGAVASGKKVSMFFTFWGLNALRKKDSPKVKKTLLHSIFAKMMPKGADKLKLSNLDMAGIGTSLMKRIMREKRVESLSELIESAKKSKIKLIACQMTMDVMGIAQEELLDGVEVGGVAKFLEDCDNSGTSLFVS